MGFVNTKETIYCPYCKEKNEILTLESYTSGRVEYGTVSGSKYHKDLVPMRILSDGNCAKCGKSIKNAILDEFPGAKILKP